MEEDSVPLQAFLCSIFCQHSFESLPDNYKNSMFATLDNEHISMKKTDKDVDGCDNPLNLGNSAHLSSAPNSKETNLADVNEGLQHQDTSKLWKFLHQKLDAVKNLSYLVAMVTNLEKAKESVEEIHQKLLVLQNDQYVL